MSSFLTDRKRATGLGSGRHGTHHFWQMIVSSLLMGLAVPAFVITFALSFGRSQEEVLAFYGQPIPALILALSIFIIIRHAMWETLEAVEDYVHGTLGKLLQIAVTAFSYTLIAMGIFALARIAL
ncbi:MAG: succinate dehydrogenase, hydrophobic membrane anchor protein [Pseudomonadota bacterium]